MNLNYLFLKAETLICEADLFDLQKAKGSG